MVLPRSGLQFSAPVALASAQGGDRMRRFSGVAYGGGTITDHAWWDAVAFDLDGLTATAPMPLLLQHDHGRQIGVIDVVDKTGGQLSVAGKLFTGIDADADAVAAKADAGAPWQLSVGIFPDVIEQLSASGSGAVVNGLPVRAGTAVFRASRVREASFVALGADDATHASVFSGEGKPVLAKVITKENHMAEHDSALAVVTAERDAERDRADAAETKLAELRAQFAAEQVAKREAAVKELLGEEFSADAAESYMTMTEPQFSAALALAKKASRLPPGFTVQQAVGGRVAESQGVTPEALAKYRRDNPGASFELAFAALKTTAT